MLRHTYARWYELIIIYACQSRSGLRIFLCPVAAVERALSCRDEFSGDWNSQGNVFTASLIIVCMRDSHSRQSPCAKVRIQANRNVSPKDLWCVITFNQTLCTASVILQPVLHLITESILTARSEFCSWVCHKRVAGMWKPTFAWRPVCSLSSDQQLFNHMHIWYHIWS